MSVFSPVSVSLWCQTVSSSPPTPSLPRSDQSLVTTHSFRGPKELPVYPRRIHVRSLHQHLAVKRHINSPALGARIFFIIGKGRLIKKTIFGPVSQQGGGGV